MSMPEQPELAELNRRLEPLAHELRANRGGCPFVVDQEATRHVALPHYSGGRDATYVFVSRKLDGKHPLADLSVTIYYAPFVAGTTIIYDLADEMMQGKARPFVCHLGQGLVRSYAVLPVQIEEMDLRVNGSGQEPTLYVAFLDASGEVIQAALPFELRVVGPSGKKSPPEYFTTSREGRFEKKLAVASGSQVAVRSLLTGFETAVRLDR
jgi:hypothetical protein